MLTYQGRVAVGLGILFLAGLAWIVGFKIHDAITLASSPVKAYCSLIKTNSNGETAMRIQLKRGKDSIRSVHLDVDSDPQYQSYRLSYGPLKTGTTTVRSEVLAFPHAVEDVTCDVDWVVYADGREWHAPYRSPIIP
jgi:hypothetical protein